jgi:hypothetical protein
MRAELRKQVAVGKLSEAKAREQLSLTKRRLGQARDALLKELLAQRERPRIFRAGRGSVQRRAPEPESRILEMPFHRGTTSGFLDPDGDPVAAAGLNNGLVGWTGAWLDLPLGMGVRLPAMVHSNVSSGRRVASANLFWESVMIPVSGVYMFDGIPAPAGWLNGSITVQGEGWVFSDNDASAEVNLEFWMYLDDSYYVEDLRLVESDATKSEERTRSFSHRFGTPDNIMVQAEAGQRLSCVCRISCPTWANDEGAAAVRIRDFGFIANLLQDVTLKLFD